MDRFFGKREDSCHGADRRNLELRRTSTRRDPQCDELEPRWLLSKSALPSEGYLSPGAGEVAAAQTMMSNVAGPAFQNYASELQRLEQSSHITPAQFSNLKKDMEQLAENIDTSAEMNGTDSITESEAFILVQDAVDEAFVAGSYTKTQWKDLETDVANGFDEAGTGSGLNDSDSTIDLPQQIVNAMKAIARSAHVTAAESQQLTADQQALTTALGAHVSSTLGGEIVRDPITVYYQGQLSQFVHKR